MAPETFGQQMALLGTNYRQEIPEPTQLLWWTALRDLPDEAFVRGCAAMMREITSILKVNPALIREAAARERQPESVLLALTAGDYDEAKAVAYRDASERIRRNPPSDEVRESQGAWQARIDDMLARRDAKERETGATA